MVRSWPASKAHHVLSKRNPDAIKTHAPPRVINESIWWPICLQWSSAAHILDDSLEGWYDEENEWNDGNIRR